MFICELGKGRRTAWLQRVSVSGSAAFHRLLERLLVNLVKIVSNLEYLETVLEVLGTSRLWLLQCLSRKSRDGLRNTPGDLPISRPKKMPCTGMCSSAFRGRLCACFKPCCQKHNREDDVNRDMFKLSWCVSQRIGELVDPGTTHVQATATQWMKQWQHLFLPELSSIHTDRFWLQDVLNPYQQVVLVLIVQVFCPPQHGTGKCASEYTNPIPAC